MVLLRSLCMSLLFVLLVGSANAGAVSRITIAPTAVLGEYIVLAADVHDAAGIDFIVYYDIATLINPKVTTGPFASNAIMKLDSSTPGSVRVMFISDNAFNGTGQLATITFTKVGTLAGRLTDFKSSVYSSDSVQVAAQPIIATSAQSASDAALTSSVSGTAPNSSAQKSGGMTGVFNQPRQQATGGEMKDMYTQAQQQQQQQSGTNQVSVTLSGDSPVQQNPPREEPQRAEAVRVERKSEAPQKAAQSNNSVAAVSASFVQTENSKSTAAKNAKEALALLKAVQMPVQRFRAFNGAHTVKGLIALFDASAVRKAGVVQVPDIAVSDGKKMVTVKIELAASGVVPNFSLRGANLKSIRPISDKVWMLDALPQKGKSDVQLSVLLGGERVDIPLVVIPPLDAAVIRDTQGLSEAGVGALLAKADTKSNKPAYDLNGDGRQDFIDDYILVAHYLLKVQKTDKPAQRK